MKDKNLANHLPFISGNSELAKIILAKDWSKTELDQPASWPDTLKILLSTILNSKFPMFIWWGNNLNCFYNDAYRPSLGVKGKHPSILGMPAKDAWPEIWHFIKPLIDKVWETGESTWRENQLVPIFRDGKVEDAYWTFCYSQIVDTNGTTSGVLVSCTETTDTHLSLKKLKESENQLSFAIEAAELATWDYDPLTNNFQSNGRLKEWFGLEANDEISLDNATNVMDPKDVERVKNDIKKALEKKGGGRYNTVYKIKNKKTGQLRTLKAMGRAWFNEKNEAYRFNGTLQDITEAYNAEQENQKLLALLDASQQIIGLADVNLNLKYCNPAGRKLLGIEKTEGKNLLDCIYPEDLGRAKELIQKLKTEDYFSEKIRVFDQESKHPIWINWNCVTVKDSITNEIVGIGTVSSNIEEEKRNDEVLHRAFDQIETEERKFRNLVENAPVGIAILKGNDFTVELANIEALKILGKKEKDVRNKPLLSILPAQDNNLHNVLKKVLKTGESQRGLEFSLNIKVRGREVKTFFNSIFHLITDEVTNEKGIMVVANNVTESVKFKRFLQESEKQFRNFVLQSPIAMTIFQGPDLVIQMANKVMYQTLWRKQRHEVIGKKLLDVFPELHGQKYPQQLKDVLELGKSFSEKESHAIIKGEDGQQEFYLDYEYAPLREVDGTISGVMVTVNDVSDKVRARLKLEEFSKELEEIVKERTGLLLTTNQKLKTSIAKLEKTNEELESFAYISSHDLQEPLRKIQIFSSRIKENYGKNFPVEVHEDFNRIVKAATRMRTLIDDLLSFSMTNNLNAESKVVNLYLILNEVIDGLREKLDYKDCKIHLGNLCDVKLVPFQIQQVFTNLIENSMKFARDGVAPVISITSKEVPGKSLEKYNLDKDKIYCKIIYKDNGIGFEEKYGEQIFDLFQRLHGKEHYKGTGIGLAIVKKIIQNHNGHVEATGTSGEGATFTIYIPVN